MGRHIWNAQSFKILKFWGSKPRLQEQITPALIAQKSWKIGRTTFFELYNAFERFGRVVPHEMDFQQGSLLTDILGDRVLHPEVPPVSDGEDHLHVGVQLIQGVGHHGDLKRVGVPLKKAEKY